MFGPAVYPIAPPTAAPIGPPTRNPEAAPIAASLPRCSCASAAIGARVRMVVKVAATSSVFMVKILFGEIIPRIERVIERVWCFDGAGRRKFSGHELSRLSKLYSRADTQ